MILDQTEIDSAAQEAERLSLQSPKTMQRVVSKRFERGILAPELDLSGYVQILLTAYLASPAQIKLYRNQSEKAPVDFQSLHVIFEIEPFSFSNGRSKVIVDESSVLAPLVFRDYLRRVTLSRVDLVALKFGCLEVEYLVRSSREDWKSRLRGRKELASIFERLKISKIY